MSVFVYQGTPNSIGGPPDVYVVQQNQGPIALQPGAINVRGCVGTSNYGVVGLPQFVTPGNQASLIGTSTTNVYDLPTEVGNSLQGGVPGVYAVRETDGTDTAAVLKLLDSTGFATGTFTVTATTGVAAGETLSYILAPAATASTASITLSTVGSSYTVAVSSSVGFAIGDAIYITDTSAHTITGIITSIASSTSIILTSTAQSATSGTVATAASVFDKPVPLTVVAATVGVGATAPTAASIASQIAVQINTSGAVVGSGAFLQPCVAVAATIPLFARVAGAAGNTISLFGAATSSPAGFAVAPTTVTAFTGGSGSAGSTIITLTGLHSGSLLNPAYGSFQIGSQSTPGSPTYRLTLVPLPNSQVAPEIYDNVLAYATAGSGFSMSSFITNLVNAVNGTPALSSARPASGWFSATAGASSASVSTGTLYNVSTNGTDGALFGTPPGGETSTQFASLTMLGSSAMPYSGMYALAGLVNGGIFTFAGNSDPTTLGAAAMAFAQANNAIWIGQFPTGTTTVANIATKQSLGIQSPYAVLFQDFSEFADSINNIPARRWPSAAFAADFITTQRPDVSPMNGGYNNSPLPLVTGTERFSSIAGVPAKPYYPAELVQLQGAGINVITNSQPSGYFFGIRLSWNTMGKADPRGEIGYTRMNQFFAQSLGSIVLGKFIGKKQTSLPNDETRSQARACLNGFIAPFAPPSQSPLISGFTVQCDQINNPPDQQITSNLVANVNIQLGPIVDNFVIGLDAGYSTVAVAVNPPQQQAV